MCHPILNDIKAKLEAIAESIESIRVGNKQYLSSDEAAEYLCVSKSTLYKHTHKNNITHFKPNGKLIIFTKEDLDIWINRVRIPSNDQL